MSSPGMTCGCSSLRRLFYDVHVDADEIHQHIAVNELVGGLFKTEPDQVDEAMFGAWALGLVESSFADCSLR